MSQPRLLLAALASLVALARPYAFAPPRLAQPATLPPLRAAPRVPHGCATPPARAPLLALPPRVQPLMQANESEELTVGPIPLKYIVLMLLVVQNSLTAILAW